jgi:hypothetical protein
MGVGVDLADYFVCSGSVTFWYPGTDPDADPDPRILTWISTNKVRIRMRVQEAQKYTYPDHCIQPCRVSTIVLYLIASLIMLRYIFPNNKIEFKIH